MQNASYALRGRGRAHNIITAGLPAFIHGHHRWRLLHRFVALTASGPPVTSRRTKREIAYLQRDRMKGISTFGLSQETGKV